MIIRTERTLAAGSDAGNNRFTVIRCYQQTGLPPFKEGFYIFKLYSTNSRVAQNGFLLGSFFFLTI